MQHRYQRDQTFLEIKTEIKTAIFGLETEGCGLGFGLALVVLKVCQSFAELAAVHPVFTRDSCTGR